MLLCVDRKTRYFVGDKLNWDEDSHDGRAVRQQCKPLHVRSSAQFLCTQGGL